MDGNESKTFSGSEDEHNGEKISVQQGQPDQVNNPVPQSQSLHRPASRQPDSVLTQHEVLGFNQRFQVSGTDQKYQPNQANQLLATDWQSENTDQWQHPAFIMTPAEHSQGFNQSAKSTDRDHQPNQANQSATDSQSQQPPRKHPDYLAAEHPQGFNQSANSTGRQYQSNQVSNSTVTTSQSICPPSQQPCSTVPTETPHGFSQVASSSTTGQQYQTNEINNSITHTASQSLSPPNQQPGSAIPAQNPQSFNRPAKRSTNQQNQTNTNRSSFLQRRLVSIRNQLDRVIVALPGLATNRVSSQVSKAGRSSVLRARGPHSQRTAAFIRLANELDSQERVVHQNQSQESTIVPPNQPHPASSRSESYDQEYPQRNPSIETDIYEGPGNPSDKTSSFRASGIAKKCKISGSNEQHTGRGYKPHPLQNRECQPGEHDFLHTASRDRYWVSQAHVYQRGKPLNRYQKKMEILKTDLGLEQLLCCCCYLNSNRGFYYRCSHPLQMDSKTSIFKPTCRKPGCGVTQLDSLTMFGAEPYCVGVACAWCIDVPPRCNPICTGRIGGAEDTEKLREKGISRCKKAHRIDK